MMKNIKDDATEADKENRGRIKVLRENRRKKVNHEHKEMKSLKNLNKNEGIKCYTKKTKEFVAKHNKI